MSQYEKAWQAVTHRIQEAAARTGRAPQAVRLLAVSKTFPAEAIRAVHALGQRAFGENYVQEAAAKRAALQDATGLELRLIGPLQSNKAALAATVFDAVETIDRLKIAQRLSTARDPSGKPLEVLVQVNISGEASKSGVAPGEALALARAVAALPRLRLRGFMGIAEPLPEGGGDEEATARVRRQYATLRKCRDDARAAGIDVDTLSMGMSADLELAVEEGATQVRVGTALFGARTAGPAPGDAL